MFRRDKIAYVIVIGVFYSSIYFSACRKPNTQSVDESEEWRSGGIQTVFVNGSGSFSEEFPSLTAAKSTVHEQGDAGFEAVFNSDPKQLFYGLGPVFNNVSCVSCHIGDGRGKAPVNGEPLSSMLIRLSVPGTNAHGGPNPVPGFGGQLQQRAIFGVAQEADVLVTYTTKSYTFPDGEIYELRTPDYKISNPYQLLPADYMFSPRIASPVFGLGLLEAIPESALLYYADENDKNGDGISGKPNTVWNVLENKFSMGRFGWKAGQPTVLQQSAGAYNEDMGITSYVFPTESTYGQTQYQYSKGRKEVSDSTLWAVAYYVRTLAVPGRRNVTEAQVQRGKILFYSAGCANCHIPKFKTSTDIVFPEFSNQTIFPYTDLLLHDMGSGLADYRPEFAADGLEWRTSPLWGIGLTNLVNGHNNFLHDGRARNFVEAIMWHGGEAEASKNAFYSLSTADRKALLKFLESL